MTSGSLELDERRAVIRYEEIVDEALPAQAVAVTVEDGTLVMERGGEYATQMVFSRGRRYEGQYETPYGAMDLAVFCTRLKCALNEEGGEIQLSYQMDLNGQFAAVHDMEIRLARSNVASA